MKIQEMHQMFRLEVDRVDSSAKPDFEPWEIDAYLYRGILKFLKDRYGADRRITRGFETDQARISQLSSLHVKAPSLQPGVIPISTTEGIYELRLNSLGQDINGQYFRYMFMTDGYIKAKKDSCIKVIPIDLNRVDQTTTEYTDSSWLWRRVVVNFGKSTFVHPHVQSNNDNDPDSTADLEPGFSNRFNADELSSLYLDSNDKYGNKEFEILEVFVSYIKYPNRVFIGGYDHVDGMSTAADKPIHCDIDEAFHEEIVSTAVRLVEEDIQDAAGVQIKNPKLQEYKAY